MGKMMKAAVFEKVEKITVKQVPVPEISEDEVLIKVKYTGNLRHRLEHLHGQVLGGQAASDCGARVLRHNRPVGEEGAQPQGR